MIFVLHYILPLGTQRKRWDRLKVIFQKEGLVHGGLVVVGVTGR
jgi:hypothetical protein